MMEDFWDGIIIRWYMLKTIMVHCDIELVDDVYKNINEQLSLDGEL
jgi:hypothetical protein